MPRNQFKESKLHLSRRLLFNQLIQDTNDAMKMKRLNVAPLQDRNEAKTNVDSWSDIPGVAKHLLNFGSI